MARKKSDIPVIQESRDYVLWRRVSTVMQGESGLGLEAQVTIAKMFMRKDPVEIFTDVYSGTKLKQCVGLWQAIDYCKAHNAVLVVAKVDRFRSVNEALDVLDCIGERNIIFCDCPSSDRFVLTVLFAMNERTAIIGRVNTKIALAERKKQIEKDGGFISKAGNFCDHLGRQKGDKNPNAVRAMRAKLASDAEDWKLESALYTWATRQLLKGYTYNSIVAEAKEMYERNPDKYCTRKGKPLNLATLSRWAQEVLRRG